MMNDEIEEFGVMLERIGLEYEVSAISAYGKDLAEAASSFRIDQMNELFRFFPSLLQKIS
jgi:hypothetical protein